MPADDSVFNQWMRQLDAAVLYRAGVSVHDLADQPFRDWFDEGIEPSQAAELILDNEGF